MNGLLTELTPGMTLIYGGNRTVEVPDDLAEAFRSGDRLIIVQETGELLHIPASEWSIAHEAVTSAREAFAQMSLVDDDQIWGFFERFADHLEDESRFASIAEANRADMARALEMGRSTTRLELSAPMRRGMIEGLRLWAGRDVGRGRVEEVIDRDGWTLSQVRSGLGVVGFVFEGRPNVFADAMGVMASGNTVVFRIGSDALGTARAIMEAAVVPALRQSGLPEGAVSLVDGRSHAAGWAMFADPRLALAVARGSGQAVRQLGAVARQSGVPVSLHGTGGAWLVAAESADAEMFGAAVLNSLDRKVCNTLNTVCVVSARASELVPVFLDALERAGANLATNSKLHVTAAAAPLVPESWFEPVEIERKGGPVVEPRAEPIEDHQLGVEWEWESSPEVTLAVVDDVAEATALFNQQGPLLVVSLVSEDAAEQETFFRAVEAPFVGNGFTRWVDGQYALDRPELGLSNWEFGRLLGRSGVLSGDSVYTVRMRVEQSDRGLAR